MRKSDYNFTSGERRTNILEALSHEQLALVGAVLLTFNDAEDALKSTFMNCLQLAGSDIQELPEVVSLGQMPGITLKLLTRLSANDKETSSLAENTLVGSGFTQIKKWRDGVAHARLLDSQTAIARVPNKGSAHYVMLSTLALEGLYERTSIIRDEMKCWYKIAGHFHGFTAALHSSQNTKHFEQSIQSATAEVSRLQNLRSRLKPLPPFPQESAQVLLSPHKRGGRKTKDR